MLGCFILRLGLWLGLVGVFGLWVFVVIWSGCLRLLAGALFNDWLFTGLVWVCYLWFRLGLLGFYVGFVVYFDLVFLFSIIVLF